MHAPSYIAIDGTLPVSAQAVRDCATAGLPRGSFVCVTRHIPPVDAAARAQNPSRTMHIRKVTHAEQRLLRKRRKRPAPVVLVRFIRDGAQSRLFVHPDQTVPALLPLIGDLPCLHPSHVDDYLSELFDALMIGGPGFIVDLARLADRVAARRHTGSTTTQ